MVVIKRLNICEHRNKMSYDNMEILSVGIY